MSDLPQNILADLNDSENYSQDNNQNGEDYEFCVNCSRKFFLGRLALHLKSCTKEKPYKPATKGSQRGMNETDSILKRLKNDLIIEKTKEENNDNELCECIYCGRTFFPERIEKHEKACQNAKKIKAKASSSNSQRIKHFNRSIPANLNNAESQQRKASKDDSNNSTMGSTRSKWRLEHERFLKSIRKWKNGKIESSDSRLEDDIDEYADYIKCQFCMRKFAPRIADRHIPKCKEINNRPKPPKSNLLPQPESSILNRKGINQISASQLEKLHLEGKKIIPTSHNSKFDNEFLEMENVNKKPFPARQLPHLPSKLPVKQSKTFSYNMNNQQKANEEKKELGSSFIDIQKKLAITNNSNLYPDVLTRSTNYSKMNCDFCNRKFAPAAAERHIPICKSLFERHTMNIRFKQRFYDNSKEKDGLDSSKMFASGFGDKFKLKNIQAKTGYKTEYRKTEIESLTNVQLQNYCPKCSFQFDSGHLFCAKCGAKRHTLN